MPASPFKFASVPNFKQSTKYTRRITPTQQKTPTITADVLTNTINFYFFTLHQQHQDTTHSQRQKRKRAFCFVGVFGGVSEKKFLGLLNTPMVSIYARTPNYSQLYKIPILSNNFSYNITYSNKPIELYHIILYVEYYIYKYTILYYNYTISIDYYYIILS